MVAPVSVGSGAPLRSAFRRLVRRALAGKWIVLSLALAVSGAVVAAKVLLPGKPAASVTFRIDELVVEAAGMVPRPTGLFREYVEDTVLTHAGCLALVKKLGLYPAALRRGPRYATDAFLEDLELVFYRNFFLEERSNRSAMLTVRYAAPDPLLSWAVVNEIAVMIARQQREEARERAAALVRWSTEALAAARERQDSLRQRHAETLAGLVGARGTERRLLLQEAALLSDSLYLAGEELERLAEMRSTAGSWLRFEKTGSGLSFTLVDSQRPVPEKPTVRSLAAFGLAVFVPLLLLIAIGVGAFAPHVYDRDDVRRLGLPVIGHVPAFAGWEAGTLRARQAGERLSLPG